MAYESKDNEGVLFKNDKQGNEKRPDYTGTAVVHGQQYQISAWINENKDKSKRLNIKFSTKDKKYEAKSKTDQVYAPREEEDSTIPF